MTLAEIVQRRGRVVGRSRQNVERLDPPVIAGIVTTILAVVVLGLAAVAVSGGQGAGRFKETRPTSTPTASPNAISSASSSVLPTASQAEGLEFHGRSSAVVGPIELGAGYYRVVWRARALSDRCVFGALLRPVDGGTLELIPAVSGPHEAILYGSAQSTLDGGSYFLDVTGSSGEWRIALEAVSPSPSSSTQRGVGLRATQVVMMPIERLIGHQPDQPVGLSAAVGVRTRIVAPPLARLPATLSTGRAAPRV